MRGFSKGLCGFFLLALAGFSVRAEEISGQVSLLQPQEHTRDLLDTGTDYAFWIRPDFLHDWDQRIFAKSEIPFWQNLQFSLGGYANVHTGPVDERRYTALGIAPGVIYRKSFGESGRHEFLSQFDLRMGWAWASRVDAKSEGMSSQPTIYAGYQYHYQALKVGLVAEYMLNADAMSFYSLGAGLRLTYQLGGQ